MINVVILVLMVGLGIYLRYFSADENLKGIIAAFSAIAFPIIMFIMAFMKKRNDKKEDRMD